MPSPRDMRRLNLSLSGVHAPTVTTSATRIPPLKRHTPFLPRPLWADCCYRIPTETELTILFDETLFGYVNGPPELLVTSHDPDLDSVDFTPQLQGAAPLTPGVGAGPVEGFVLRFSRTQHFSQNLVRTFQER
jgi:hypothetical protein